MKTYESRRRHSIGRGGVEKELSQLVFLYVLCLTKLQTLSQIELKVVAGENWHRMMYRQEFVSCICIINKFYT